jgi:hypothetical protein
MVSRLLAQAPLDKIEQRKYLKIKVNIKSK